MPTPAAAPLTSAPFRVPPRPLQETVLLIAAAVALQAIVWAFLIALLWQYRIWYGFHDLSDSLWYLHYADLVARGQRVYRDFSFEYPPLALPLLLHDALAGRFKLSPYLYPDSDKMVFGVDYRGLLPLPAGGADDDDLESLHVAGRWCAVNCFQNCPHCFVPDRGALKSSH